jgi:histidine ammonia-lyase
VAAYRAVLACELIAVTRALRLPAWVPAGDGGLRTAYDLADSALERATADRPLDGDLAGADGVLAAVAPWPAARPIAPWHPGRQPAATRWRPAGR